MKDLTKIKDISGITILKEGKNAIGGKYIIKNTDIILSFIATIGCGWEHVSVSTKTRTPTWEEMCIIKNIFWNENEACFQLHPKASDYVNNKEFVLHIWKPVNEEVLTPPSIMVGFRKGKEVEDLNLLLKYADQMPRWSEEGEDIHG